MASELLMCIGFHTSGWLLHIFTIWAPWVLSLPCASVNVDCAAIPRVASTGTSIEVNCVVNPLLGDFMRLFHHHLHIAIHIEDCVFLLCVMQ